MNNTCLKLKDTEDRISSGTGPKENWTFLKIPCI